MTISIGVDICIGYGWKNITKKQYKRIYNEQWN